MAHEQSPVLISHATKLKLLSAKVFDNSFDCNFESAMQAVEDLEEATAKAKAVLKNILA